ncbi:hypothetical protein [Pseudoclavibacter sp. VKM Ac-2867]|uniref:hypothetical protein n=1 Tax=Pseudoclavibacter sp. VKM Ac-2867 TaxID=2783829 RepID=UPI00188BA168|nr:hypothetical protein [Pseudoclavibacter sp. VKM Ac-2867]MBF4460495.1 hypothetical protein [Pseudoclavibacter sp. VKM Ac-2867]
MVTINETADTKAVTARAQEVVTAGTREAGYATPPVDAVITGLIGELHYDRGHDTTPFKAGGGLTDSAGLPYSLGSKVHGVGGLSAGHCAMNGNYQGMNGFRFTNSVIAAKIGDTSSNLLSSAAAIDLMVLKPVNIFGDFATKMYRGPQAVGSNVTNTRGTTGVSTGADIGFSGNWTGSWTAYGNSQVPGSSTMCVGCFVFQPKKTVAKWITIGSLWQAGNNGNGKVTDQGDSGGPAYSWIAGSQDVKAVGSITGGNYVYGVSFFTPTATAQYVYGKSVG